MSTLTSEEKRRFKENKSQFKGLIKMEVSALQTRKSEKRALLISDFLQKVSTDWMNDSSDEEHEDIVRNDNHIDMHADEKLPKKKNTKKKGNGNVASSYFSSTSTSSSLDDTTVKDKKNIFHHFNKKETNNDNYKLINVGIISENTLKQVS